MRYIYIFIDSFIYSLKQTGALRVLRRKWLSWITNDVRLGRSEVLRSLRHCLQAQSQGHRLDWGDTRRKRNRSTIFLERTTRGRRQQLQHTHWKLLQQQRWRKLLRETRRSAYGSVPVLAGTELNWFSLVFILVDIKMPVYCKIGLANVCLWAFTISLACLMLMHWLRLSEFTWTWINFAHTNWTGCHNRLSKKSRWPRARALAPDR